MSLPETREEEAPDAIKLIYADMRRVMRLPLVNLIYRHLATVPGALPHAWAWVRDLTVSGDLDAALARMTQGLPVPEIAPFAADALGADDRLAVRRVLDAYNRGNGLNVIALTAVRMDLHQRAHASLAIPSPVAGDGAPSIPRLLKLAELPPDVAGTVTAIAALHDGMNGVIPSLYLHLANWPAFLSIACARIAPVLEDGSAARARRAVIERARVEAKHLIEPMRDAAKTQAFPDAVLATIEKFVTQVIPEMLPIGLALDRALPARADN